MSATALCTLERISTPTWTVPKFHSVLFLKKNLPADISTRLLADLEIEKGAFAPCDLGFSHKFLFIPNAHRSGERLSYSVLLLFVRTFVFGRGFRAHSLPIMKQTFNYYSSFDLTHSCCFMKILFRQKTCWLPNSYSSVKHSPQLFMWSPQCKTRPKRTVQ